VRCRRSRKPARETLKSNGVAFVDPPIEKLASDRKRMIEAQGDLIRDAKLSAEIVKLVSEAVGSDG
jgi:TRAP-type transport system periplasmic protein